SLSGTPSWSRTCCNSAVARRICGPELWYKPGRMCGVHAATVTPSVTKALAISIETERSAAPSSRPGRMWQCRSNMIGHDPFGGLGRFGGLSLPPAKGVSEALDHSSGQSISVPHRMSEESGPISDDPEGVGLDVTFGTTAGAPGARFGV